MRRSLARVVLAAAVAFAAFVLPASTASATSPDSTFSFCNQPPGGSTIACFSAHLHFSSRNYATLSNVVVTDELCDNRSAEADAWNQTANRLAYFLNSSGCGTAAYWSSKTISDTAHGLKYVHIDLFACNQTTCSGDAWSLKHYNPYW
jgi:hypothetical protein